jgi:hypothetical protein
VSIIGSWIFEILKFYFMEDNTKNIQQNSPAQGKTNSERIVPDAPTMNDSKASVGNDNMMQGIPGREMTPEFGDAADPTSEQLGQHHRDE